MRHSAFFFSSSCVLPSLKRIIIAHTIRRKKERERESILHRYTFYAVIVYVHTIRFFFFPCLEHDTRTTMHHEQRAKLRIF